MSRRSIDGDSQRAYRVVKKIGYSHGVFTKFFGPYSTLVAAKGKKTTEQKHEDWYPTQAPVEIYIERTSEGWERVEPDGG